jgi:tRNA pseudouridine32 synthase/23S rRNA pseudouridine746 synthase
MTAVRTFTSSVKESMISGGATPATPPSRRARAFYTGCVLGIEILHRDAHLLVVTKPAGLLTVPGIGAERQDCLIARVQRDFPAARIVHRLDRATSGVIVVALDAETHRALSHLFHERNVKKTYVAVVGGIVAEEEGEIDLPLRLDIEHRRRSHSPLYIVDHELGKASMTRWSVVSRSSELHSPTARGAQGERGHEGTSIPSTRLELHPITGRSHQLRVHLSAIGHPIFGDDIYAPPDVRDATARLMLHAESLEFTHPCTGEPLRCVAPAPF